MALLYFVLFVGALVSVSADPPETWRSRYLPGAETEQDPTDPKYINLAMEAFSIYYERHYHTEIDYIDLTITRVTTQVVAGIITRLDFDVDFPANYYCHAEVLEQEWTRTRSIDVNCIPPLTASPLI